MKASRIAFVVCVVGMALMGGCSEPQQASPQARLVVPGGRTEFVAGQRTTEALPGSGGQVRLTVDDVTRGQVMASIATAKGEMVLPMCSMKQGERVEFSLDGRSYTLMVKELRNVPIGEDSVVFVLAEGSAGPSEEQKIEALIGAVEKLEGALFLRNGQEHSPEEAAAHMRGKYERAKEHIHSAREFIEMAATRSSISGEKYRIRLKDGREMESGAFLLERLEELEMSGDGQRDARAAGDPSE